MPQRAILPAMTIALREPQMTRAQFFAWAEAQDARYEFDGVQPVAMTGGSVNHSQITLNIHFALRTRLRGIGCRPLGPDAGVATIGDAVRYPDALVTCTRVRARPTRWRAWWWCSRCSVQPRGIPTGSQAA